MSRFGVNDVDIKQLLNPCLESGSRHGRYTSVLLVELRPHFAVGRDVTLYLDQWFNKLMYTVKHHKRKQILVSRSCLFSL